VVTYQNVPEYGTTDRNSFQIELFYDGEIRVTYLQMAAQYGLAGLSAGLGVPTLLFAPSDFSAYSTCPAPTIVTQPTEVTVLRGSNASFSVVAAGTPPLSYQWRFNGVKISGATSSSFTKTNAQPADIGSYSVVVASLYGSIVSTDAALTLLLPPSIAGPTNLVAGLGLDATFTVTATGTPPLAYQWQFNGTNLAGATTTSLTISNVQPANAGTYQVVVTNLYGTANSSSALLIVQDPFIVSQPQSQSVAVAGASASFSVAAIGTPPLSYQWLKQGIPLVNGANISGAQTSSLTVSNVQAGDMANYSVVVSNLNGWVTSSNARLVGPFALVILSQPASQKVLAGSTVSFTADAFGGGPLGFQWRLGTTPLHDSSRISGSATASLMVSNVQAGEMGSYSVVVSNAYGQMTSSNALLTIWPLVGWGLDSYGQADIPGGLTNVTGIAAGVFHSLALRADGTVAAWGAGATNAGAIPQCGQSLVPNGLTNVAVIAAGAYHSLAVRADGTMAAWGAGATNTGISPNYGQGMIPAGLTNVVAVAAGLYHNLVLMSDGTVMAWGYNNFGQTNVPTGLANVAAVAAGWNHSLALKSDRTVVAWGYNNFGQTNVPSGLTNVVAVACGFAHSLALRTDGTVVAWGYNNAGQTDIPSGLTNVVAVACGFAHSLALRADGTVSAWGNSDYGQTNIPSGLANVMAIASGSYHNLVLESDGSPSITLQPLSQTVTAGTTLSLLVMAVGHQPLSYQWQFRRSDLTDNARITGSWGNTLTIAGLSLSDAGSYQVIVTNDYGSATSAGAALTVSGPPVFQAVTLSGGTISLEWSANAGSTYQLQYNTNLTRTNWTTLGAPITATNSTVTASDIAPTDPQRFYRVMLLR